MADNEPLHGLTPIPIAESRQRCKEWGMDPKIVPDAEEVGTKELQQIVQEYQEVLEVVAFFIPEFLSMIKGTPLFIVVTNRDGVVIYMEGDSTIKNVIQQLGFRTGVKFSEAHSGTNSISLALDYNLPIEVVGRQHFHEFLMHSACYSVPFDDLQSNQILGTISIMTGIDFRNPLLLSLLSILAESIEREILLRRQNKDLNVLNQVLMDSIQTAMIITDRFGNITEFNHYAEELTGIKKGDILHNPAQELDVIGDWIGKVIDTKESYSDIEVKISNPQAAKETVCLFEGRPIYSESHRFIGTVGSFRNITERYENQLRMNYQAHHDDLTGLPNRRYFHSYLSEMLQSAKEQNRLLAVFLLDLDRFKLINDTLGHAKGDYLLIEVAQRLQNYLQNKGKAFRMGGDEFTIVLSDLISREEVIGIAEDLIQLIREPYEFQDLEFHMSTSIGISLYPHDGQDLNTLLIHADTAMYRAKDKGKNGYAIYNADMSQKSLQKLTLETEIDLAIRNNDLMLHYQPQIDIVQNRIIGMEALLRWNHPDLGMIQPDEFIPLAEEMGLMGILGEWVLKQACRQMKAWHDSGYNHLKIAVNLSPQDFLKQRLVEKVRQVLDETGLPPACLELEITESMTMDVDRSTTILNELREIGVQIAIDDFGTGFSSLNYLKSFHLHRLKIDRSFVRDMISGNKDAKIVGTMISMAHGLHLKVLAEGVETVEQLEMLKNMNCDEVQGYLYSKPMTVEEIEKSLGQNYIEGAMYR
ncbi:MAG TPA: EAL domain-containing protein [Bacillaceae bacterium]